ncbi:MAG: signal peptide peptidase SppA [Nitrososphaerota archaeon]
MKSSRWVWLLIGLVIGVSATSILFIGFISKPFEVKLDYVAVVELSGTIAYLESPLALVSGETITPREVEELLGKVENDPYAKAVVLVINSPGGSASASEEIYNIIKNVAGKKILVSYITEYGASGGYYIALPSREIIASPHSLTGSIGAISIVMSIEELAKKLGIEVEVFKSGEFKDIGSGWRKMNEEERKILQSMIEDIAEVFVNRVREHRGGKIKDWDEVLSARPYTGTQALKAGLVDSIGSLEDAINKARELAGLPQNSPVKWVRPKTKSLLELLFGGSATNSGMKISYEVLLMWPPPITLHEKLGMVILTEQCPAIIPS